MLDKTKSAANNRSQPTLFTTLRCIQCGHITRFRASHACDAVPEFFQSEICIEYFVAFDNSYNEKSMQRGLQNMHIHMTDHYINLLGWVLFLISAIGFCIASVGSFWAMFGSVFFLIACLVFMIPFFRRKGVPDDTH